MTILVFEDRGWVVTTSAWSVGSKIGRSLKTRIVYIWGGDGIGWSDQSTGTAAFDLTMTLDTFLEILQKHTDNGICDLRPHQ